MMKLIALALFGTAMVVDAGKMQVSGDTKHKTVDLEAVEADLDKTVELQDDYRQPHNDYYDYDRYDDHHCEKGKCGVAVHDLLGYSHEDYHYGNIKCEGKKLSDFLYYKVEQNVLGYDVTIAKASKKSFVVVGCHNDKHNKTQELLLNGCR